MLFKRKEKIGLALEGGGARGSYQIGAYFAFMDAHIHFDGICGTSIGAFNGAMLASHKEKELLNFWENADIGKILSFDEDFIAQKNIGKKNLKLVFTSLKQFFQILKDRGIKIDGLKKTLDEIFDEEALRKSNIDFGLCTLRLKALKPCYFFKEDMTQGLIDDYILASCYLPVFHMTKKIDNHYYLDGGFYDNQSINMLLKKGYKKIYVVSLNAFINIKRKLVNTDAEIIYVRPSRSLGWALTMNKSAIQDNIKMGYYDAYKILKHLDGYLYVFKRKSNWYYQILSRNISKKERKRIYAFFHVHTSKEACIHAIEYCLKNISKNYYQIYHPYTMIKEIRKNKQMQGFVYDFVRKLRFL